jgi:Translocon-associated protein beta (TRAPB)
MKSRSLLVFILILSVVVVPSLQLALAASSSSSSSTSTTSTTSGPKPPYSERLDLYTAGSNAYWQVNVSPVNATRPAIVSAESVSGVSAYELTAMTSSAATASSQLFWGDGYHVIKLPFIPTTGVFLNVTASSKSAALSAAAAFGPLFGADFLQVGSGAGNYTFFSPAPFATAGQTIFSMVPSTKGGMANLTSFSTLSGLHFPIVVLTGVRSGSSFTHTVGFGSTQEDTVSSLNFALATALGKPSSNVTSSRDATSTQVVIHSLDGLILSNDPATITNDRAGFSGTYSISSPPGSIIYPNVTLLQDPPILSATRTLDMGSAASGDLVSVTLTLSNTGSSGTIHNMAVDDGWWRAYPSLFAISAGNSSFTEPSLVAGQNVSRVYVLKVLSSAANDLKLPSAAVPYSYSLNGLTINSTAETNQNELRTNEPGPALTITAAADSRSGSPLGTRAQYLVTVTNVGNGPAINLQSGAFTDAALTPGGAAWKFNSSIPQTSLLSRNFTATFAVSWTAPDGSSNSLTSNPVRMLLSHSGVILPIMHFSVTATLTPAILKLGVINASYTISNSGGSTGTNITVTQALPAGMSCKSVINGTAACTSSGFSVTADKITPSSSVSGKVTLAFSNDNYQAEPALVNATYIGIVLHTAGNALSLAAGVTVTKTYATNPVFEAQNDTVTVRVTNQGSLPVFNLTATAQSDSFDSAFSGALQQTYATLTPGSAQSFNYTVKILAPGNHTTAATSVAFTFGGAAQSLTYSSGSVLVYKLIQVTTTTVPTTPIEGSDFLFEIELQNPTTLDVTNVSFSIPIPQGFTIVNASSGIVLDGRTVTLSLPSLAPGASATETIALRAGTDGSTTLRNGLMTFQYLGATIHGVVTAPQIVIGIDLLTRFEIPIGIAILLTIAVAVYMHRKQTPTQAK